MSLLLVFIASLIGSPHCAGMCGGFVAISCQNKSPQMSQAFYHFGRLLTYLSLGALAGVIGKAINKIGLQADLQEPALLLTAGLLIITGFSMLFGANLHLAKFIKLEKLVQIRNKLMPTTSKPYLHTLFLGLFSTLLPCGWLYTYVAVAGGTGSIPHAMAVMFCFWAGTLPILVTIGSLSYLISKPIKRYVPILAAIMMIIAGFYSLYQHIEAGRSKNHCANHSQVS